MVSTVRSRPTFYEILGLKPSAADEDIARAFAGACNMLRPHVFGGMADICVAYETLRDPIKRNAYDISIGIKREPERRPLTSLSLGPMPARQGRQPAEKFLPPVAMEEPKRSVPPVNEQAPAPVNASSPGEAAQPIALESAPRPSTRPDLAEQPAAEAMARPASQFAAGPAPRFALEEGLSDEVRPIEWKRIGIAAGAVVLAAGLMGGLAGWWSASDVEESVQPKQSASIELRPAKRRAANLATAPDPALTMVERRPGPPPRRAAVARRPALAEAVVAEMPIEQSQTVEGQIEPSAAVLPLDQAPPATTTAASLPLPNRVVARTIDRIGYSCGSVASTSRVEEVPGAYRVNCTSGQSYQARPVNGRFRFRRLAKD